MRESERPPKRADGSTSRDKPHPRSRWTAWPLKLLGVLAGLLGAAAASVLLLVAIALAVAYPNLP